MKPKRKCSYCGKDKKQYMTFGVCDKGKFEKVIMCYDCKKQLMVQSYIEKYKGV